MRLYFELCNCSIELNEGKIQGLSIENPEIFRQLTCDLWKGTHGQIVPVFLTERDKTIKLDKEVCVIAHPYLIDVNERKILSKLYQEIQGIVNEELLEEKDALNRYTIEFLDKVSDCVSYPITFSLDFDVQTLLKDYSVRIEDDSENMLESILNYIKLVHQVLRVKVFVFFHLMNYLEKNDMGKLSEMIAYEEVTVLLVEGELPEERLGEGWLIIDKEQCMIEL